MQLKWGKMGLVNKEIIILLANILYYVELKTICKDNSIFVVGIITSLLTQQTNLRWQNDEF